MYTKYIYIHLHVSIDIRHILMCVFLYVNYLSLIFIYLCLCCESFLVNPATHSGLSLSLFVCLSISLSVLLSLRLDLLSVSTHRGVYPGHYCTSSPLGTQLVIPQILQSALRCFWL